MMRYLNKQLVTTAKYIFFEGLSKGGEQLILLLIPVLFPDLQSQYLSILLLISLTGLIKLVNPVNNANAIFGVIDKFKKKEILNTVFFFNLVAFLLFLSIAFLFRSGFLNYYNIVSFWPIVFLAGYMFFRNFFEISSFYEVLIENHNRSLFLKNAPFLLSFILQAIFIFWLKMDIIFAFFFAKFLAFTTIGLLSALQGDFSLKARISPKIFKEVFRYSSTLWVYVFVGWLMGYGALNLTKLFLEDNYSLALGRMINLWMVLLLMANGVNNVYIPILKRKYIENYRSSLEFRNKILAVYIAISILGVILGFFVMGLWPFNDLKLIPFIFIMLFAQAFQYVSNPFYFMADKYRKFVFVNLACALFVLTYSVILFKNSTGIDIYIFLSLYLVTYIIRSLIIFSFSTEKITSKE
nr:hypothetical protein [uncultured Allomuricauda sp.]